MPPKENQCPSSVSSALDYSVRRASTGSLLAAIEAGIKPAMKVSPTLIAIKIAPAANGNEAAAPVLVQ